MSLMSLEEDEDRLVSDEDEDQDQDGLGLGLDDELPSDLDDDDDDDLDGDEQAFGAAPAGPPPPLPAFGPPYYGRPPTPLPPSPSLTSLLRPSRPTTPDGSDDEGLNNNNNSSSSSEPVPRASPKVPTYEYYGFVLYLFSSLVFLIYLLWSYLPSPFLHVLGIYYYPNRWWSLAIPSFLVMLLLYIYVALALYNSEYLTLPLNSLETIVDDAGKIAVVDGRGRIVTSEQRRRNLERERQRERDGQRGRASHQRKSSGNVIRERELDWRECWNEGTDAVMDVPLAGVCEVLYGVSRRKTDLEIL